MYGKEMWDRKHELCCEMAKREESERWEKKVAFDEMSFSGERGAEVETGAAKHTAPPHIHASLFHHRVLTSFCRQ